MRKSEYDVVIIGGSFAGLSAALCLGRSLRNVLVVDGGKPCNRFSPHAHNFLTQDAIPPGEILETAFQQLSVYKTVTLRQGMVTDVQKSKTGFKVSIDNNDLVGSRKIIFATGVADILPEIEGFSDGWGKTIIHCPYCHGYEFREKKTGLMASGDRALHMAGLIRNLTDHLTIFTQGDVFTAEEVRLIRQQEIEVIDDPIVAVDHNRGRIDQVRLRSGNAIRLAALYASLPFRQHSDIPAKLGCALDESGYLVVDPFQKTTVDHVFACGDNTTMFRSIANAVAAGNKAGAVVNMELVSSSNK